MTDNYLAHRNVPITIIGGGIHGVAIAIRLLPRHANSGETPRHC